MNMCNICFCESEMKDSFKFPNCGHIFCKDCLKETFEGKIKTKEVHLDNFKCPGCEQPFDSTLLQHFISKEMYQKYCEFAVECNQVYGLAAHEIMTNCLNKECPNQFIIWKDAEYQVCPHCNIKHCRGCFLVFHEGISCAEAQLKQDDTFYQEGKINLGLSRCPVCKFMCEKASGCNFIKCYSKQCQGKNNFCHLCDIQLEDADHFSHFQNADPFNGKICRVKVNGKWVEKKDAPPPPPPVIKKVQDEKAVQEVKLNKKPCPNCGNLKASLTEFQLCDQIAVCQTVKCDGNKFCTTCNQELYDWSIDSHFTSQLKCRMA